MFEVVGIKKVDFKTNDGGEVHGVRLHCVNHGELLDSGCAVESIFLSNTRGFHAGDFCVGDMVDVTYNKYGKIVGAEVVQK